MSVYKIDFLVMKMQGKCEEKNFPHLRNARTILEAFVLFVKHHFIPTDYICEVKNSGQLFFIYEKNNILSFLK